MLIGGRRASRSRRCSARWSSSGAATSACRSCSARPARTPLTGLKNRRRFEEDLRAELARSAPRGDHRGAADARPRPLQAGQRHPRPPGRRPPDRRDRRGAARAHPRDRRAGTARRRRVRGRPAALQRSTRPGVVAEAIVEAIREHVTGARACRAITASVGIADLRRPTRGSSYATRSSPRPTRRCTRPRTAGATASASSTRDALGRRPGPRRASLAAPPRRGPQVEHALAAASNARAVEAPAARSPATSARRGRLGAGAEVGEEQQVGARAAAATAALARAAEVGARRRLSERVGDRDPLEAEPVGAARRWRSRAAKAAGCGRERRVDRRAQHHQVAAGGDEGAVGRLVDRAQRRPSGGRSAAPRSRCFRRRRRGRESAWRSPRRRRPAGPRRTAPRSPPPRRRGAEAAFGGGDRRRRAGRRRAPAPGRR